MQAQIDGMITRQYAMSEAADAFELILSKQACKVHLLPQL